jgi:hypothetical protein
LWNDGWFEGAEDVVSASSNRYQRDPLPYGPDPGPEGNDESETPHFAGAGQLRRGLVAPDWTRIVEGTRFAGDVAVQQLREGRSLETDLANEVSRIRRPARFGVFAKFALVILVAAGAAFLIVQLIPSWRTSRDQAAAGPALQSVGAQTAGMKLAAVDPTKSPRAAEPAPRPQPKVALRPTEDANRMSIGEAVPLGLNVDGSTEGALAIVTGLLPGSHLSVGTPMGANVWHVPARDLPRVLVRPPTGYSGTMEVVVDLQVGNDQIVDRRWRRLEWTAAKAVRTEPVPVPVRTEPVPARTEPARTEPPRTEPVRAASPAEGTVERTLDPEEIAILIRRGEQLIETGDISSARLLLRRAAEARDARAAFALAGTYDPLLLSKLGVYGFGPDVSAARHWYQKAAEFGSREASARLDSLSNTGSR